MLQNVNAQNPGIRDFITCTTYPTISKSVPSWTYNNFPSIFMPKEAPNIELTKKFIVHLFRPDGYVKQMLAAPGHILPVLKPILITLALFVFLGSWNDFMWPLIVLADQDLYTLPVALAALSREHVQDNELMMAGSVVTTLPVLVLFLALQRHYLDGLLAGSVKG